MSAAELVLRRPALELVASYLAMLEEIAAAGERVWPAAPAPGEKPEAFVARLLRAEVDPAADQVPQTVFWGTLGDTVVAQAGLRHRLNEALAEFGGHIGYNVRPAYRNRGLAKETLRQILSTSRAREIGRLLLTCAPDNAASNRTIVANGGVLEKTIWVERVQRMTNLYWITVR